MQLADSDRVEITEWAKACPEIAEVWLYGSRAKDESRDDSDIDLAVLVTVGDTDSGRDTTYISHVWGWREKLKLSRKVHFWPYPEDDNESELAQKIRRDGRRLYP